MTKALAKWNTNSSDVSDILEERPWLDENSAVLAVIEQDLSDSFFHAENFLKQEHNYSLSEAATSKLQVELYFRGPVIKYIQKVMEAEIQISDNELLTWKGKYERAYTALRTYINIAFGVEEYFSEPIKNRLFDVYEAQYNSLETYFKTIQEYCEGHPLFLSEIVVKNAELFTNLINESPIVSVDEFELVSEAVMPWDIVMFKRGELSMDKSYLSRLEHRIDDQFSIYNNMNIIYDVMDKLPDERCKDLYKYEFIISIASIEGIKDGKYTFNEVLDDCANASKTSFF
jgi:hypothetical protein